MIYTYPTEAYENTWNKHARELKRKKPYFQFLVLSYTPVGSKCLPCVKKLSFLLPRAKLSLRLYSATNTVHTDVNIPNKTAEVFSTNANTYDNRYS